MMNREIAIRLIFFFSLFVLFAVWERYNPRRQQWIPKKQRWFNNLSIASLDALIVRLLLPLVPVSVALLAKERGWGLFSLFDMPYLLEASLAVIALDFVIYIQHVLFHAIPLLWRFHIVHHADLDLDVTSGLRFHPIEIILSMAIKLTAVALLGAPPGAVLLFEMLLNGTSMFNHSNLFIPLNLDRILRLFVVTPDMHRVHHSVILKETDSNYGFSLPWWDRLLGTYRSQPTQGHQTMRIGLSRFLNDKRQTLRWLLVLPFLKQAKKYS